MRAVVQRVSHASVEIEGKVVSKIPSGILVFIGIEDADTIADSVWLAKKISSIRIFSDKNGLMNKSINEIKGEILVVSQFTLYAKVKKGKRPSYIRAASPSYALPMYERFIKDLSLIIDKNVHSGEFGAMMKVDLINDGPVTIIIDTKNKE